MTVPTGIGAGGEKGIAAGGIASSGLAMGAVSLFADWARSVVEVVLLPQLGRRHGFSKSNFMQPPSSSAAAQIGNDIGTRSPNILALIFLIVSQFLY